MENLGKGRVGIIDVHVGIKLKDRRILLGLNQYDLGEAVDVSIQQIQKYESAKNRISSGKLYSFAKLLKVPITYFFDGIDDSVQSLNSIQNAFAEEQEEFKTERQKISDKEVINLIKAYSKINNESKRKSVFDLVKVLGSVSE